MLKIKRSGNFDKMLGTFDQDPETITLVGDKIKLFRKNPSDTRLHNHALRKKMKGKFAFNVTGDIRIVYEWLGKNSVRFLAIGSHSQVYRKAP